MKFNLLQSQALNGNSSSRDERRSGITGHYQSSFSTLYRLIDLSVITVCFYAAVFYHDLTITTTGMILLFINVVSFQMAAEAMDLYRSWRSSQPAICLKQPA